MSSYLVVTKSAPYWIILSKQAFNPSYWHNLSISSCWKQYWNIYPMVCLLAILFFHVSEQNCFCLEIHYTIAINCIKKLSVKIKTKQWNNWLLNSCNLSLKFCESVYQSQTEKYCTFILLSHHIIDVLMFTEGGHNIVPHSYEN